jgi:hypothetical protein
MAAKFQWAPKHTTSVQLPGQRLDFRFWPKAAIPIATMNVRY